jgi:hypothetical protein
MAIALGGQHARWFGSIAESARQFPAAKAIGHREIVSAFLRGYGP